MMEIYNGIAEDWLKNGISVLTLSEEIVLFSGQHSTKVMDFDHTLHTRLGRPGIWTSESVSYAVNYCYFGPFDPSLIQGRKLFELRLSRPIDAVHFPSEYHPGHALKRTVNGERSDRFVSQHWGQIVEQLSRMDERFAGVMGHVRSKSRECSLLIDVWISDPHLLEEVSAVNLAIPIEDFRMRFGKSDEEILRNLNWDPRPSF